MPRWRTCGFSNLPHVVDRTAGNAGGLEALDPVEARALSHERLDDRHEDGAVPHTLGVGAEARVLGELRMAGDAAEARKLGIVADRKDDVTVRRGEHLVGDDVRVRVPETLRNLAGAPVIQDLVGVERHQRVEERHVDVLADPGELPVRDRGGDGETRVHAGQYVGHRDPDLLRPAAGELVALAGDAHQSAHALEDEVIAGALRVRSIWRTR
jgi:hypothetical protein